MVSTSSAASVLSSAPSLPSSPRAPVTYDVFFSYAQADAEAALRMINYLREKDSTRMRVYNAEPRSVSVRKRGVVHEPVMEAINQSRVFLALLSDEYFHSVECTEAFSLAYCRDFDSQGNFIIPLFWRTCDLTPLARRLVATEGIDCREAAFESARMLLDEILLALAGLEDVDGGHADEDGEDYLGVANGGSAGSAGRMGVGGTTGPTTGRGGRERDRGGVPGGGHPPGAKSPRHDGRGGGAGPGERDLGNTVPAKSGGGSYQPGGGSGDGGGGRGGGAGAAVGGNNGRGGGGRDGGGGHGHGGHGGGHGGHVRRPNGSAQRPPAPLRLADTLLMKKDGMKQGELFSDTENEPTPNETVSQTFFDRTWRDQWAVDFKSLVFGPRIGAGGFGEVYKCKLDRTMVAAKTLQKVEDDDPHAVMAEFMVEMKLMSMLEHPNVVTFLGACIHHPNLAIILEFMPGGSLYRAIHRRRRNNLGPFPLLKTLWIAFGVAKGLDYLHSQYPVVIHRDCKSPNILLGTNVREVKITDFGLSRLRVSSYVNTGPGGTPEWMAPELLRQDPFDEQSDVFSFGVILWELVMCEKPWRDDHPMQVVFRVGSRGEKLQIPPPSPTSPEVCIPELREMIIACMRDEPSRRPKTPDLVRRLDFLCHRVGSHG